RRGGAGKTNPWQRAGPEPCEGDSRGARWRGPGSQPGRARRHLYRAAPCKHDPKASMKSRILLVEDEAGVALVVSDLLRAEGHSVETAADGKSGLRRALAPKFDLL